MKPLKLIDQIGQALYATLLLVLVIPGLILFAACSLVLQLAIQLDKKLKAHK